MAKKKIIQDSFAATPVILTLNENEKTFYVLNRTVDGNILHFTYAANKELRDEETNSVWNIDGSCVDGKLKGKQLAFIQSYQEFWHSWKSFHPETEVYK